MDDLTDPLLAKIAALTCEVEDTVRDSRPKSIAITKLDEARMWLEARP